MFVFNALYATIDVLYFGHSKKNYYVIRNAGCTRSGYTLKLSSF